jgi:hypothetical protein
MHLFFLKNLDHERKLIWKELLLTTRFKLAMFIHHHMRNEHKLIWKSRNISVNKQGKGKIQGKASVTGPAESHKSQC